MNYSNFVDDVSGQQRTNNESLQLYKIPQVNLSMQSGRQFAINDLFAH